MLNGTASLWKSTFPMLVFLMCLFLRVNATTLLLFWLFLTCHLSPMRLEASLGQQQGLVSVHWESAYTVYDHDATRGGLSC